MLLILFVWALMTAMCLSGARTSERAARHDFLLQLELRSSRQMAQSMLNNMLPEHIVGKLRSRTGAASIEEGLVPILDDDAQTFVIKLWRMLCYEMRAARAIS